MLTESKIAEYAEKLANNWKKFDSFAWSPPDNGTWGIYYTHNRDSTLLDESNHHSLLEIFEEELSNSEEFFIERHNHWAVGWVEGFVFKVYEDGTQKVTEVFEKLCEQLERLENYPLLDEDDYSKREYDATLENISFECGYAKGHEAEVFSWLYEHNDSAIENVDDQGGYPSQKQILEALDQLYLLSIQDRIDLDMVDDPYDLIDSWNDQECFKYMEDNDLKYEYTGIHRDTINNLIIDHMYAIDKWEGKPTA